MKENTSVKRKIHIEDYSTDWPALFEKEKKLLQGAIGDVQLERIGSTSICGLGSKPVIDMIGVVHNLNDTLQYVERLETLGYKYTPKVEILIPDVKFFQKKYGYIPECHISFTEKGSDFYARQIIFRNYLRKHPEYVRKYEKVKRNLAKEHIDNFDTYSAGKKTFIFSILEMAWKEKHGVKYGIGKRKRGA